MIFLQCVPKDFYFCWQLEVQITNFRKFGIANKMEIVVWYPKGHTDFTEWKKLEESYPEVKFFYYEDSGVDLALYIPQIRPHSLKKHFAEHRERLKDQVFFYHDADIIFNFLPNFEELEKGDMCYQSDCSGYLDYNYMLSKEIQGNIPDNEAVKTLCQIGNVSTETFISYNGNTGGAQNVLKNIDAEYWEEVERTTMEMRKAFYYGVEGSINKRYFTSEDAGVQSWTVDMWAVNMALWKRGIKTQTTKELDFSWATDNADTYLKKPIMHNSGATGSQPGIFFKGRWIDVSPLGKRHATKKDTASWYYVQAIYDVVPRIIPQVI